MAGAYYIWIFGALFIGVAGVIGVLIGLFYIGHLMEKKETGSRHGFMELPEELRETGKQNHEDAKGTKEHEESQKI